MINYEFFYDIAAYINIQEKQLFSYKEVATHAYEYLCEFISSSEDLFPTEPIKTLYSLLVANGSETCLDWAYTLAKELDMIDMDYLDYLETDKEIIRRIMEGN